MDTRSDFTMTAGISLVVLFEHGEFFVRVLHRHAKPRPTYLTRHIPVPLADMRSIAKGSGGPFLWESDEIGVRVSDRSVFVYRLDAEFAMAMGSAAFLARDFTLLLRQLELEQDTR